MDHVSHEELWFAHYEIQYKVNDIAATARAEREKLTSRLGLADALIFTLQAQNNTLALRIAALELAAGTHATDSNNDLTAYQDNLDSLAEHRWNESQQPYRDDHAANRKDYVEEK